jgi:inhibitor of the pro-sigma K processing machinery
MIVVAVVAIAYYLVKKFSVLLINAILGLLLLVILNFFHMMNWIGKPDLGYSLATILICGVGGLPGVGILVLLLILGITI